MNKMFATAALEQCCLLKISNANNSIFELFIFFQRLVPVLERVKFIGGFAPYFYRLDATAVLCKQPWTVKD